MGILLFSLRMLFVVYSVNMSLFNKSNKASIFATHSFQIRFIYHPPTSYRSPFLPSCYAASVSTSTQSSCPYQNSLVTDFSVRRSTPYAGKLPSPKSRSNLSNRHTTVAKEALQQLVHCGKDNKSIENALLNFEPRFCASSDYAFLLRELADRGDCNKGIRCFEFALRRERRKYEKVKLANVMISTLGRLGQVELAKTAFENALKAGYGRTGSIFTSLINVYGRNGYSDEAIGVFGSMEKNGLKPNIVTYNVVFDACAKGDVDVKEVLRIFDGMLSKGLKPDQFTFNSLLAGCSRKGQWETARDVFSEMVNRGLNPNIITYSTFLNVVCKGGQMDMASEIMSMIHRKNILPDVVTYSIMINGYVKLEKFEEALRIMAEMRGKGILPDDVSYSIMINGLAQAGRLDDARNLFNEMKVLGVYLDKMSYTTLISIYAKFGRFQESLNICKEMKNAGIKGDVVTYSTLIDVYSKAGLYKEAMEILREFKRSGLKANVGNYGALIDALCKNGLVESAMILLDEMSKEGIKSDIVIYTSIIDAFGKSAVARPVIDDVGETSNLQIKSLSSVRKTIENQVANSEDDNVIDIFGQLASKKACKAKKRCKPGILSILRVLQKMREFEIRPNVATFSAILNTCCQCDSFEDASLLLKELQLFDPDVYGVTHGLLMGYAKNVWPQAQSLFDDVKLMDSPTACNFYNSLTDILWHFDQRQVAQLIVLEGKRRQVWENLCSDCHLDLHRMSSGAACAMVHSWLLNLRSIMFKGHELPKNLRIVTGWGKHSKVVGDGVLR